MAKKPERLTLDTMILRDYWEKRKGLAFVEQLLDLADAGEVDLAVTATIRQDVPDDPMARRIHELPELRIEETGTVARWGIAVWGRDMWASSKFEEFRLRLQSERQPGDSPLPGVQDWDHLHAHMLLGRDVFLTRDGAILRLRGTLRSEFGIVVMSPEEYLEARAERG
jgi:hypothetical protein